MAKTIKLTKTKTKTKTAVESSAVVQMSKEQPAEQLHYYRLSPTSKIGKAFMQCVLDGVGADKQAAELAKEMGAEEYLSNPTADMGGLIAVVFPDDKVPEGKEKVFKRAGNPLKDGRKVWEINVKCELCCALYGEIPEGTHYMTVSDKKLSLQQAGKLFTREQIARAIKMELKYHQPVEYLHMLGLSRTELQTYVTHPRPIAEVLQGKMLISKRDKANKEYAFKAEEEHNRFLEAVKGKEFSAYYMMLGVQEACELQKKLLMLPIVPAGRLNAIVGLTKARYSVGFFLHQNHIWLKSGAEPDENPYIEREDDWEEVTEQYWNLARDAAEARGYVSDNSENDNSPSTVNQN